MDATEQIKKFQEFFETDLYDKLMDDIRIGKEFFVVNFSDLSKFSPELAEDVLEEPEETIKAAEIAVEQFDLPIKIKKFNVRFTNLPKSQKIMIRNIRSKNIGKLLSMDGVVRQKSDVRPQVTSARFECPSCGNVMNILQLDTKFQEPSRCGCGRKGKFKLLSKELIDAQGLVLEEAPESLEGGEQPKRINILLKDDLVSPISDKRTNPGTTLIIAGQVKEVPLPARDGGKLTRFDLMVEANSIEACDEDYGDIEITKKEEEQILELSKDPKLFQKMLASVAPGIYGHDKIKEALLLQLVGGIQKKRSDGVVTRGDMHILLIGDPGSGKSQILKRATAIAPKGRYVSGKGASGAGLTASVVKDEFLKGWALEAGALVLANKGFCMIDELDKMTVEDRSAMHEALEQQTVTISKANIQATLRAETTVLAAANPKFGRFDPYETIAKQIDLPPTLINRFDLIFPIKDLPDKEKDGAMADFILNLHKTKDVGESPIDTEIIRKFISYARQKCFPKLTEGALEEIKTYYLKMRGSGAGEDGGTRAIPISARQLEGLIRLAESSAKLRLSDKVTKKDAKRGIDLLHFCLSQIGVDPETGQIDIDRITTGITNTERSRIMQIKEVISELENKIGKTIPIDEILKESEVQGIDADKVDELIEKLKRSGDIFEPRRGFITRI